LENELLELLQYGALGAMLIMVSGYIIYLTGQHRAERTEWQIEFKNQATENRKLLDVQQDQLLRVVQQTNSTIGTLREILIKIDAKLN